MADEMRWEIGRGQVRARVAAQGVLVFQMSGHMGHEFVRRFDEATAPHVAHGQIDFFFDTEAMKGYEPQFREQMTQWHKRLKPSTRSANVLIKSKMVAMAISIANLVTGGILKAYSSRSEFEAALAAAVERAKR
jgi:hypothetical protein